MSKAFKIKDFPNYYVTDSGDVYSANYMLSGRIKKNGKMPLWWWIFECLFKKRQ